jgi:phosphoribosylaminoimidazolecarboxamide formyltransferase / IMP cyclohydrolase
MEKKYALLSVYYKDGIVEFAMALIELGWNIIASGGTAKVLKEAGISVTNVAEISGLPAVLGHRVVTLVPQIHGGLMATEEMQDELNELGYPWIDLLCVDLYPLEEAIAAKDATTESVIDKTDIGGPALIRSAAKGRRIVVVAPYQREEIIEWLKAKKPDEECFRNNLAAIAEATVAQYCLASAKFHSNGTVVGTIEILREDMI